jgi:hypothetical protein
MDQIEIHEVQVATFLVGKRIKIRFLFNLFVFSREQWLKVLEPYVNICPEMVRYEVFKRNKTKNF